MAEKRIFVGRGDELKQFAKVLERPLGEAVLVVGQRGMGKTWLITRMGEIAESHPKLSCGWVRYEVTPTDSVDSTMALMIDNAFEAAQVEEGSFDGTQRSLQQWKALLNIIKIGDLVMSLRRNPAKNTREQFLERLRLISKRMPENGRAVFIIDPEKYMQEFKQIEQFARKAEKGLWGRDGK
jgi:ABC-type ATPase with predicted acetyltransferase domain